MFNPTLKLKIPPVKKVAFWSCLNNLNNLSNCTKNFFNSILHAFGHPYHPPGVAAPGVAATAGAAAAISAFGHGFRKTSDSLFEFVRFSSKSCDHERQAAAAKHQVKKTSS